MKDIKLKGNMKKQYKVAQVEIQCAQCSMIMWPATVPEPHSTPKGHYVPGPGPSYDPQGSVV